MELEGRIRLGVAFRIWNAALHPDVESLVAKLLQDAHTKRSCEEALLRTSAWKVIAESIRGDR